MRQEPKHLDSIAAAFVSILLVSNIASAKILVLGPFTFDGGTVLFPISYIFGDILTEVYGYSRSRRVIWMGFAAAAVAALVFSVVGVLPPAEGWENQEAYDKILGQTPRIVAASLMAYFCGEFSNSFVLAKMKILTGGKLLWTRTIGSTLVGEALDSSVFVLAAFAGQLPAELLATVLLSNYVFKIGYEVAATPITYAIVGWLKAREGIDAYDRNTDLNPFKVAV